MPATVKFAHAKRLAHGSQRPSSDATAPTCSYCGGRRGAAGAEPHISPPLFQSHRHARSFADYARATSRRRSLTTLVARVRLWRLFAGSKERHLDFPDGFSVI